MSHASCPRCGRINVESKSEYCCHNCHSSIQILTSEEDVNSVDWSEIQYAEFGYGSGCLLGNSPSISSCNRCGHSGVTLSVDTLSTLEYWANCAGKDGAVASSERATDEMKKKLAMWSVHNAANHTPKCVVVKEVHHWDFFCPVCGKRQHTSCQEFRCTACYAMLYIENSKWNARAYPRWQHADKWLFCSHGRITKVFVEPTVETVQELLPEQAQNNTFLVYARKIELVEVPSECGKHVEVHTINGAPAPLFSRCTWNRDQTHRSEKVWVNGVLVGSLEHYYQNPDSPAPWGGSFVPSSSMRVNTWKWTREEMWPWLLDDDYYDDDDYDDDDDDDDYDDYDDYDDVKPFRREKRRAKMLGANRRKRRGA